MTSRPLLRERATSRPYSVKTWHQTIATPLGLRAFRSPDLFPRHAGTVKVVSQRAASRHPSRYRRHETTQERTRSTPREDPTGHVAAHAVASQSTIVILARKRIGRSTIRMLSQSLSTLIILSSMQRLGSAGCTISGSDD